MHNSYLKRRVVQGSVGKRKTEPVSFGDLVGVVPQPAKAHTVEKMTQEVGKILANKHRGS